MECSIDKLLWNNKKKNITIDEKIKVAKDIAKGIKFLNNNGMIHRDLKSLNILIKFENNKIFAK